MRAIELFRLFGNDQNDNRLGLMLQNAEGIFTRDGGPRHLARHTYGNLQYVETVLAFLNQNPEHVEHYSECLAAVIDKKKESKWDRESPPVPWAEKLLELIVNGTKLAYTPKNLLEKQMRKKKEREEAD